MSTQSTSWVDIIVDLLLPPWPPRRPGVGGGVDGGLLGGLGGNFWLGQVSSFLSIAGGVDCALCKAGCEARKALGYTLCLGAAAALFHGGWTKWVRLVQERYTMREVDCYNGPCNESETRNIPIPTR
jgi:hypothetical protein